MANLLRVLVIPTGLIIQSSLLLPPFTIRYIVAIKQLSVLQNGLVTIIIEDKHQFKSSVYCTARPTS